MNEHGWRPGFVTTRQLSCEQEPRAEAYFVSIKSKTFTNYSSPWLLPDGSYISIINITPSITHGISHSRCLVWERLNQPDTFLSSQLYPRHREGLPINCHRTYPFSTLPTPPPRAFVFYFFAGPTTASTLDAQNHFTHMVRERTSYRCDIAWSTSSTRIRSSTSRKADSGRRMMPSGALCRPPRGLDRGTPGRAGGQQ